jgi:uncharacterized small protein (DUF1192 family)
MIGDVDCLMARLYEKEQALRARPYNIMTRHEPLKIDREQREEIQRLNAHINKLDAEIERLQAEIKRGRMFRVKLWDALRELADLVKDEA